MSFQSERIDSHDQSRTAPPHHSLPVFDARRLTDGAGTAGPCTGRQTYTLRIRGRAS